MGEIERGFGRLINNNDILKMYNQDLTYFKTAYIKVSQHSSLLFPTVLHPIARADLGL